MPASVEDVQKGKAIAVNVFGAVPQPMQRLSDTRRYR